MEFRQINLDFHTSECIPRIGKRFDKEQFQRCLKEGHIQSINLFAKCHHGWSYYPSKVNEIHPELDFDLLGTQIEAAHEIGVKTPLYFSGGFDEKTIRKHPEWRFIYYGQPPRDFTRAGWHGICFNTEYTEHLCNQIYEALSLYEADGVFVDISEPKPCVCEKCCADMRKLGLNPDIEADTWKFGNKVYDEFTKRIRETVDKVNPKLNIFHNAGHVFKGRRDVSYANSHLEIESLPTGGWGYDHFPISASYARTLGMDYLGMTAKFNFTWGEFGGYKHPNALRYEVSLFAAHGAKFSVGDQLHPSGEMDEEAYRIIGMAYTEAEKKEPWLKGAKNIADIGVLGVEAIENYYTGYTAKIKNNNNTDFGCVRILNEGHYLYNFIDADEDFSKYKLIILPDKVEVDEHIKSKLNEAIKNGTKILASGKSGLMKGEFAFDFGCKYLDENEFNPTYIKPKFPLKSFGNSSYVIYSEGHKIELTDGMELAVRENPYFNRTVEHFCSHLHAPSDKRNAGCGIAEGKDGIYIAWELFNEYAEKGSTVSKEIVCAMIDKLIDKTVQTNLPCQGVMTLTKQSDRKIVHLLYATAAKRGDIEVIEDILPVYDTDVKVKSDIEPKRVYLAPQNEDIEFSFKDGFVEFTVNKFECHQMVVIEY